VAHIEAGKINGKHLNARNISATTPARAGNLLPLVGASLMLGGLALAFRRRIA
jgi:hypothetical protein